MGPRWQMSPLPLDPEPQYMLIVTHQQTKCNAHGHHDSSKVDHSITNWVLAQSWKSLALPQIARLPLPLLTIQGNYPPHKNTTPCPGAALTCWDGTHSVCGVCFSLNKSTSYLSLCLSLSSFHDETSRPWVSLSPETMYIVISTRRSWVQTPVWVLVGF